MGFTQTQWLGLVLLFSCGNLCVAFNRWTNETESGTEQVTVSVQSNQTEPIQKFPVRYRLRSYQLRRNPKPSVIPQASEVREPQQEVKGSVVKALIPGPDLNPPVKQEPKVLLKFEPWTRVQADSVAVRCGESKVTVEVKHNFLGNSQSIQESDLTLGGCATSHSDQHVLQFQTELHDCGSKIKVTNDALIYSFNLSYVPTPIGTTFIVKTNTAEVLIECHYQRRQSVSSSGVRPSWIQFNSDLLVEHRLGFYMHLMTEDWQRQRPSSVYFLSNVMHIEVGVLQGHHVPLRVFVDSCAVTAHPDPSSHPRYDVINNHGCFIDAKLTGAKSFHTDHSDSLYITCHLKATTVSRPIDSQHKACSFLNEANRWVASGGDNKVCGCCESSCREQRQKRSLAADAGLPAEVQWEETLVLGPILLEELTEVTAFSPEQLSLLRMQEEETASDSSLVLWCAAGSAVAVMLLLIIGFIISNRQDKSTEYTVTT
ncbi:zona pellucida sperm-binding protein 3-like [Cynoglossus semilaevis]|uniref:zona pellucida sperm-binding protein 3-like n=1 Tax=Cynoglossus semilaevis TaxID=244447 RepID=UPI000495CAE4|nr:zona pellucida sperm-binding protein 3-like [Cynoglossus semilaevis]